MTKRLAPYGSAEHLGDVAKVGKGKTARRLADRMPSSDIAAKVGFPVINSAAAHRLVRLNRHA